MKRLTSRSALLCTAGVALLFGSALTIQANQGLKVRGATDSPIRGLQVKFVDMQSQPVSVSAFLVRPDQTTEAPEALGNGMHFFDNVEKKVSIRFEEKASAPLISLVLPDANLVHATIVVDANMDGYKVLNLKSMDRKNSYANAGTKLTPWGTPNPAVGGGPANDLCATASPITDGATAYDTTGATTDGPGDAGCEFDGQTYHDIWFAYTATCDGELTVSTCGTADYDTDLVLYDGTDCNALSLIVCDDDTAGCADFSTEISAAVVSGNEYLIRVGGFSDGDQGTGTLNVSCVGGGGGGDNNLCGDATEIFDGTTPYDTTGATTDGPGDASCEFDGQTYHDIWFTYTATCTGDLTVSTCNDASYDTDLVLYDGTDCNSLVLIDCSDDAAGCADFSSEIVAPVVLGNDYLIRVGGFSDGDQGVGNLTISCDVAADPPANDDCDDAEAIVSLPTSIVVDTTGATTDLDLACGVGSGPFQNVWYSVTGSGSTITASTCSAGTLLADTKISIFCGDCLAPLCVDGNDDDCAAGGPVFASTVSWCAQNGAEYLISVGGFSDGDEGVITLDVSEGGACVADVICLPQGACCLSDGTCVILTGDDCAAAGGDYLGDGSSCAAEAVADGSFEAGAFSGNWIESSTNFGTPLCTIGGCGTGTGTGPFTGDWWAWFGGITAFEAGSVEQSVTITPGSTDLSFWFETAVGSGNGTDFMRGRVDGNLVYEFVDGDAAPALGYSNVIVPIGAFADGGNHTLRFESEISGSPGGSNFFLDEISIGADLGVCQTCIVLDFETEDDGVTVLANGQDISTPPEFGVHVAISGSGNNRGPAIFDSTPGGPNDPGPFPDSDLDLLVDLGNLLILQEDPNQSVPGFFNDPDDAETGGSLIFDFVEPVECQSVDLVDIDGGPPAQCATVTLIDGSGLTRTYSVPAEWTSDLNFNGPPGYGTLDLTTLDPQPGFNSVATASEDAGFDPSGVVRAEIALCASGAVDNFEFCK